MLFLKGHEDESKIASDSNFAVAVVAAAAVVVVVVAADVAVAVVAGGGGGGVVVDSAVAVDIQCPRCEMMGWMDLWPNRGAYLELMTL